MVLFAILKRSSTLYVIVSINVSVNMAPSPYLYSYQYNNDFPLIVVNSLLKRVYLFMVKMVTRVDE